MTTETMVETTTQQDYEFEVRYNVQIVRRVRASTPREAVGQTQVREMRKAIEAALNSLGEEAEYHSLMAHLTPNNAERLVMDVFVRREAALATWQPSFYGWYKHHILFRTLYRTQGTQHFHEWKRIFGYFILLGASGCLDMLGGQYVVDTEQISWVKDGRKGYQLHVELVSRDSHEYKALARDDEDDEDWVDDD